LTRIVAPGIVAPRRWMTLDRVRMRSDTDFDITVVGGGIVGLATAYRIATAHPHVAVGVLEKEAQLAWHQTGHNSGVIHSGLYYTPGSAKAATCTAGRKVLVAFARTHGVPHQICGKIVVATEESELPSLDAILERGLANGVEGLERIGPERIRQIEPFVAGIAAIQVPCAAIIDFVAVAHKLAELTGAANDRNRVLTEHEVLAFDKHDFFTNLVTNHGNVSTKYVINCGGLQSDRIARMDNVDPPVRIVPFRGDYSILQERAAGKIRNLVYPVPDPAFPFLGVHFTRAIDGSVECGPNAVFALAREGYRRTAVKVDDVREALSYAGTWKLFARHWRYGLAEYGRAFWKRLMVEQLRRLVPSLGAEDIRPGKVGVRAQAVGPDGGLVDDFQIETQGNAIHVLNAPSPAATACLAIGDQILQTAEEQFGLGAAQP
jgi:L-2-hydroxyglutarate oxidase LhgO